LILQAAAMQGRWFIRLLQ